MFLLNLARINVNNYRLVKNQLFLKNIGRSIYRCLSNSTIPEKVQDENKSKDSQTAWLRMYYLPSIKLAFILNRFKLYQTCLTVVAVPSSIALYKYGLADWNTVQLVTGCAAIACCTLYLMTLYFKRLIGIMAISEDANHVKISHLTFWGRRKDIVVPIEDIVPLGDCECKPTDIYVKLRRYSTEDVLYFSLRYGKITEKTNFELVFGSLDFLGVKK